MTTEILTPLRTLRLIGLFLFNILDEALRRLYVYLPTIFPEPMSYGMPKEPEDFGIVPFKAPAFDIIKEDFIWYKLTKWNHLNDDFMNRALYDDPYNPKIKPIKDLMDLFTGTPFWSPGFIERMHWHGPDGNPLSFYIESYYRMIFLPDWVERLLYNSIGDYYDPIILHGLCAELGGWLCLYATVGELRGQIGVTFISFNMYAFKPTAAITNLYEPWIDRVFKYFPKLWGIPMHYGFFYGSLKKLDFDLLRVLFTGPFLPSEGVHSRISNSAGFETIDGVFFEGFPTMWEENMSIPNYERLQWYEKSPEVYNYIIKTYHTIIEQNHIITLPDHIIQ